MVHDMDTITNIVIGQHLRRLRKRAGLSQYEVAHRCQLSQSYVSKIELGERTLLFSEMFLYAEALGLSCDELLFSTRHVLFDHLRNLRY